jgi:hypothetical protein
MHRITLVKTGTEGRTQVTPVSLQNTYTGHREKTFAIEALFFVAYALAKVHRCRFVLASQRFDDLQAGPPCHVHRERPYQMHVRGDTRITFIDTRIPFIEVLLKIDFTNSSRCRNLIKF